MNLKKYIPFEEKTFRPYQEEVIKEIINEIECDTETILLNAPVGAGKSMIGYCVAKYLEEQGESSYIYTKTTFLQDQYLRDFKDLKTAMGRSNFPCLMSDCEYTCDYGLCKQKKYNPSHCFSTNRTFIFFLFTKTIITSIFAITH